ncbi:calcium-binding protein, partial [Asticcacaulis biprosthecium]|uniref:calcium-binding protein n=1 Tax=Asticcacaulis biprosthecium TaxID=76891 RepID=UPI0024795752
MAKQFGKQYGTTSSALNVDLQRGPLYITDSGVLAVTMQPLAEAGSGLASTAISTLAKGSIEHANYVGTSGNDTYGGTGSADYIEGRAGDDVLSGGGGSDYVYGEGGNDTLSGGTGYDYVSGGEGNDLLDDTSGGGELDGDAGNDTLTGGTAGEYLYGDTGNDLLNA